MWRPVDARSLPRKTVKSWHSRTEWISPPPRASSHTLHSLHSHTRCRQPPAAPPPPPLPSASLPVPLAHRCLRLYSPPPPLPPMPPPPNAGTLHPQPHCRRPPPPPPPPPRPPLRCTPTAPTAAARRPHRGRRNVPLTPIVASSLFPFIAIRRPQRLLTCPATVPHSRLPCAAAQLSFPVLGCRGRPVAVPRCPPLCIRRAFDNGLA